MNPLPRSLRGRLLALLLGALTLLWCVVAAVTWWGTRHELDELLDGHLAQAAALLAVQQTPTGGRPRGDGKDDDDHRAVDAPNLHRYAPKVAFQVWHEGRLAMRSSNAPAAPMSEPGAGFRTQQIDGRPWRVFAATGAANDVQVYVGEQLRSRRDILLAVLRGSLSTLAAALPLLALAVWWAVHGGTAPLRRLGRVLAAREPGALQPLALGAAPSEMAPLLAALNGLFARIAALLESERRFTADAAHELRTPIAAIRAQAQVALAATNGGERAHALRATLQGCDRAAHLVAQLLTLARLEAQDGATATGDAAAALRRAAAAVATLALDKHQQLDVQAEDHAPVRCDEALLAVLARNLLDNAARYSPAGATIRAVVRSEPSAVVLTVEDSGAGLAPADLARLGERFFRVLGSGETGSGLGWSIVRRIAAASGGVVTAGRAPALGGLAVQVSWPRAAEQAPRRPPA